jgi:homoserine trans-succinylase
MYVKTLVRATLEQRTTKSMKQWMQIHEIFHNRYSMVNSRILVLWGSKAIVYELTTCMILRLNGFWQH